MKVTNAVICALVACVTLLIACYTVLTALDKDTAGYVSFIQLLFAATTSVVGVVIWKKTSQAVVTASDARLQIEAVSEQVAEVKDQTNGNISALIARVGPVLPENDIVIAEEIKDNELRSQ